MGKKVSITLSDEVFKQVEDFRRKNPKEDGSIQSRNWAVETLIQKGLASLE